MGRTTHLVIASIALAVLVAPVASWVAVAGASSGPGFAVDAVDTAGPVADSPTVSTNQTQSGNQSVNQTQNGTQTPGPVDGLPSGVAGFLETSSLSGAQTDPPSLAGKIRVESEHRSNTTIELIRNSSTNFTLNVTVTGHPENVSFYLQKHAVTASQNISNVTAEVDGSPVAFGTTQANNSGWIAWEVDHFSTRQISFTSDTTNLTNTSKGGSGNLPTVVGNHTANDTDGDGLLEDLTGDGRADVNDVIALYSNVNSAAVQNNPGMFNFNGDTDVNGNAAVDITDVIALYNELF